MLKTYSDTDLIAAVKGGNQRAFGEIVRRYEPVIASTIVGMLGPGAEADDAGQESMIKLYQSLGRFKGEARLKTYVSRIAINTALDTLRRRKRDLKRYFSTSDLEGDPAWQQPVWEQIESSQNPGRSFEIQQSINRALAQLKPEFRTVAVLRLIQGYSTKETAEILEIENGTVLSRLSRAKSQLMGLLQEEYNDG